MVVVSKSKEQYCNACRVGEGVPTFTLYVSPGRQAHGSYTNLCKQCLEDLIKKAQDALNSEE